jgi:beta-galactosidase
MWTGIDYLGETSWPHRSSSFGVLDLCGFPKDGYYFYQSQWTVKPMVYIFPHWNWEGQEGKVIPVLCFTNCDEVELFLNGKSFGAKSYFFPARGLDSTKSWGEQDYQRMRHPTTGDLHLAWDVTYEPGTLRAVGKKDGEVVCVYEVATAGAPAQLEVTADRVAITADGMDVVHLTVQVLDTAGRCVPKADNLISFEITGEGSLIGVDNGDPASHESFQARECKAFNGMCLAIVSSTSQPGEIQVKVTSPGVKTNSVVVKTGSRIR